jgi:two-component sensor histidine kinase
MTLDDLYRLLRAGHVQAQGVVDTMTQPILVLDQNLCISTANNAFLKTFEVAKDDVLGEPFFALGNGQWNIEELRDLFASIIPKTQAVVGYEVKHDSPRLGSRTFLVDARRLVHPDDNSMSIMVLFDDVTERQRREMEKDVILSETRHRMRNLFAVVRSVALQIKTEGLTATEYRDHFLVRLEGTLRAQEIAATNEPLELATLIRHALGEANSSRLACRGPSVTVDGSKIVALSLIFHELATNALKYGALSTSEGEVSITWSWETDEAEGAKVRCVWQEKDGPPVVPPQHKGFGSELIGRMARHIGGTVELQYPTYGLAAVMTFASVPNE